MFVSKFMSHRSIHPKSYIIGMISLVHDPNVCTGFRNFVLKDRIYKAFFEKLHGGPQPDRRDSDTIRIKPTTKK